MKEFACCLKLLVISHWNSVLDVFESHIKAVNEIREVAEAFPDRVNNRTVSQFFFEGQKESRSAVE